MSFTDPTKFNLPKFKDIKAAVDMVSFCLGNSSTPLELVKGALNTAADKLAVRSLAYLPYQFYLIFSLGELVQP